MRKGSLIIHLTDGGFNKGIGTPAATKIVEKRGIKVVHLLWEGSQASKHQDTTFKVLDDGLSGFPSALKEILVEGLHLKGVVK
jgi:hypothetical protein